MEGKQSISGAAETVLFRLPEGSWQLDGIHVAKYKDVKRSHSRLAMPCSYGHDLDETADWMLRAHLRSKE